MDTESLDDATTLAEEPDESALGSEGREDSNSTSPHFSRMLAFAHAECGVSGLVQDSPCLCKTAEVGKTQSLGRDHTVDVHRLNTRCFDLSTHAHTIDQNNIR